MSSYALSESPKRAKLSSPSQADRLETPDDCENIGDTLYSKQFVLTSLLEIVKEITNQVKNIDQSSESNESKSRISVDEKMHEKMCLLWDMSANEEVCEFLVENQILVMISSLISFKLSDRLFEILFGIVGNIAHYEQNINEVILKFNFNKILLRENLYKDGETVFQIFRIVNSLLNFRNKSNKD